MENIGKKREKWGNESKRGKQDGKKGKRENIEKRGEKDGKGGKHKKKRDVEWKRGKKVGEKVGRGKK